MMAGYDAPFTDTESSLGKRRRSSQAAVEWSSVSLPGTGHVIPPVCPNCLAPGTVPVRYQDVGMLVFLSLLLPLSFFPFERRALQTFHYCKACAEEARAPTRHGRRLRASHRLMGGGEVPERLAVHDRGIS